MTNTNHNIFLETHEIETRESVTASVIWLHGLGADGYDFAPIVPELKLPNQFGVRFVFPHAPVRPVTLNNGYPMRAWFDIVSLGGGKTNLDIAGAKQSANQIKQLIVRENQRGVSNNRIILAGFSQGGTIALYAGLTYAERLGGILALSTFLPPVDNLAEEFTKVNQNIPIFLAHGVQDDVLPLTMGQATKIMLENYGYVCGWHTYNMAHSVSPTEINDISRWLTDVLTNKRD